ncbi:unnamed protein product [Lota lota]
MKPSSVALLCLPFFLVLTHLTLAKKGMGSGGKSTTNRGSSTSTNRGSTNPGKKPTKGTQPQPGSYPKQADPNQGRPASNQWGYPQPGRGAGYPNQHPAGGYGGGYPGGHMNYNPNNRILSPGYGGSYGYGGHGGAGGSPFSRSVQGMGMSPSTRSRGFGRGAVMAAGAGVITGMALGYGLGRFPRPPFHFQSPQEESYYNHYMYKRYGTRSTDGDDYSRDYVFSPPPVTFAKHMDTCMKRKDLLPSENKQETNGSARAIAPTTLPPTTTPTSSLIPMATDTSTSNNTKGSNDTVIDTLKPRAVPLPPASEDLSKVDDRDDDDDTVSIVEIGYPALIDQLKARRCVELYMVYSAEFLKKRDPVPHGGAQGAGRGLQQVLVVVVGTMLRLASSN